MKSHRALWSGLLFPALLLTSGCAEWRLKEQCQKTNWFEHSQKVAFEGRYLDEDDLVRSCQKLDLISAQQIDVGFKLGREKMCSYDEVYNRARNGIPFFFKFCDGLQMDVMKNRYEEGLKVFCTADSGYSFGKSGKDYQKVCPALSEKIFLPSYHQGRKEYLENRLVVLEKDLQARRPEIASLESREGLLSREYSSLSGTMDCRNRQVYNELTKKDESKTVCEEPWHVRSQRDRLSSQLSSLREQILALRDQTRKWEEERAWAQKELTALPLR